MATYVKIESDFSQEKKDWTKLIREYHYDINTEQTTCYQKALLNNGDVKCGYGIEENGNVEQQMAQQDIEDGWQFCNESEWSALNCTSEDLDWNEFYK